SIEAGLTAIPAYIIEVETDRKMLELAIVENVQRVELNPIEEAEAYERLVEDCGLSQDEVAARVSKDRATIANAIRLLKLSEQVKDSVRNGTLTTGHAKVILSIPDSARQNALWEEAIRNHYSVRKLEEVARQGFQPRSNGPDTRNIKKPASELETSSEVRSIESSLQHVLGTQVRVRVKSDSTGEIAIQFYSMDEFERVHDLLRTIKEQ
ncbi:MAG TPA: ParB/RepB/Spo0J family partition protein, partial [Candidatus Kapabacteria bacterium]